MGKLLKINIISAVTYSVFNVAVPHSPTSVVDATSDSVMALKATTIKGSL